jgi:hypothetical protein
MTQCDVLGLNRNPPSGSKVKFTLEQAMKARRGNGVMVVLYGVMVVLFL